MIVVELMSTRARGRCCGATVVSGGSGGSRPVGRNIGPPRCGVACAEAGRTGCR